MPEPEYDLDGPLRERLLALNHSGRLFVLLTIRRLHPEALREALDLAEEQPGEWFDQE